MSGHEPHRDAPVTEEGVIVPRGIQPCFLQTLVGFLMEVEVLVYARAMNSGCTPGLSRKPTLQDPL